MPRNVLHGANTLRLLAFTYTNWKGVTHRYIILPQEVTFMQPNLAGMPDSYANVWCVSGLLWSKDGAVDPYQPRRTFVISRLRDVEEVDVAG